VDELKADLMAQHNVDNSNDEDEFMFGQDQLTTNSTNDADQNNEAQQLIQNDDKPLNLQPE
jgi:hypothetical protein